eukprot:TRINITY_DN61824_c0_g1_i2.p1 TRINITY_DN61824_c0_g1~~TRINITY_DN61824_c0_g1_i2.p1  ORF type:complete len:558 (+),score=136.34 TRINITY_DN61824_c0_g1_i2:57-1730(+)
MLFFFFQAEDGIRDAQESRGLGDVYKRQPPKYDLSPPRRRPAAHHGATAHQDSPDEGEARRHEVVRRQIEQTLEMASENTSSYRASFGSDEYEEYGHEEEGRTAQMEEDDELEDNRSVATSVLSVQVRDGSVDDNMVVLLNKFDDGTTVNQLGEQALAALEDQPVLSPHANAILQGDEEDPATTRSSVGSDGGKEDASVAAHDGSVTGSTDCGETEDAFFDFLAISSQQNFNNVKSNARETEPGPVFKPAVVPKLDLGRTMAENLWAMAERNDPWIEQSMKPIPPESTMATSRSLQVLAYEPHDPAFEPSINDELGPSPRQVVATWPRGMPKIRVFFVPNDGVSYQNEELLLDQRCAHVFNSLGSMLDHAARIISSRKPVRRLFMLSGVEVLTLEDLIKLRMQGANRVHLVASTGESFRTRLRSPDLSRKPTPRSVRHPTPRSSRPATPTGSIRGGSTPRALGSVTSRVSTTPSKRLKVAVSKNGTASNLNAVPVLVYNFQTLLEDATTALNLPRAARRIFLKSGKEIEPSVLERLPHMTEVVVSMGEDFKRTRHRA